MAPIPELLLERYRLGELLDAERRAVEARLQNEPESRARLDGLDQSDREVLSLYPPAATVRSIRQRAGLAPSDEAPRPGFRSWALGVPALAAAALALTLTLNLGQVPKGVGPGGGDETVRVKGLRPELRGYLVSGREAKTVNSGTEAHAGETLQLNYVSAGKRFGVVVSIDGRGQVTLHLPVQPAEAEPLSPSGEVALPNAYLLDDAPRFERFFLVTADAPFSSELVLGAARRLAKEPGAGSLPLGLPQGLEETSLLVRKVGP